MANPIRNNDQRSQPRVSLEIPAVISIGSQLSVKGQLKDLAINSAFIKIKNILYLNVNDEIGITIAGSTEDPNVKIEAAARISRIVPGEGFAVYFTHVNEDSLKCIKKLLQKSNPALA